MPILRSILSRIGGLFTRKRRDEYLNSEIQLHLELLTEKYLRSGMPLAEAKRAARLEFGSPEPMKENYRDQRGLPWLEHLLQDCALFWPRPPQISNFHSGCHGVACVGYRSEHGHLFLRKLDSADAPSRAGTGKSGTDGEIG